ncbi:hook [Asbolus verrucosus]|uniref:Protein hook n=1 Tax=Asbolus verrucosus TaxID=1661398 RepID=A0A482VB84_ASBVE|nr:hook [Asbolus verrucosus]
MNPSGGMCESLITWFQSIVDGRARNVVEICDGVAMLEALIQIAPEHFNKLEPKIKRDVSSSWRLRVSNLKKILEAVTEYYQDVLTLQLLEEGRPDVTEIGANNNTVQLAKLLRLILGCAINCERKQEYITKIMEMEESVQQNIMQAIQQLEQVTGGRSGLSMMILDSDARVSRLVGDLEVANAAKETLSQQCHQMEVQLQNLLDENQALQTENQALKDKENKNSDLRKQNEELKEELFKAEVMRDDFKAKITEQQKQIKTNQEKIAELQLAANDTSRLKDEIDALSESAAKVQVLESNLASYKKKLEKYADIKKTLQKLEEKNMEYLQKILEHEEELTKVNSWKGQCETYKKQLVEFEQKLDEETQRADKAQFNCEKLENKLVALQGEKERLVQERDGLREEVEELKLGQPKRDVGAAMSQELTPTEMKERLRFLEKENKTLRTSTQEHEANQALLESALSRIDKLQQQKRSANQVILKLEAQIEELKNKIPGDDVQGDNIIKEYKQKVTALQEALTAKENELQIAQAKYTRNLEKAREVAQQLEPKSNGGMDSSIHHTAHMKEMEERLMAAAFYKLGMTCHREAIDERLAVLSAGQGQSFLARQRQPTPRKQIQRFKSK